MERYIKTFALFDNTKQSLVMDDWKSAHQPFSPFSTFKIITSLIAIDQNIINAEKSLLTFDKKKYPIEPWWPKSWYDKPLTLKDAFQNSAVPIFRQLATQIGEQVMQEYLNKLNYGNRDISSGIDNFWLNGSLKISAVEQINCLRRIFTQNNFLAPETLAALKNVMQTNNWQDYLVFAKTGGGPVNEKLAYGWYVGVMEHTKTATQLFFAALLSGESFKELQSQRKDYAMQQIGNYLAANKNASSQAIK